MAEARVTIVSSEAEAEVVCGLLRADDIACGYRLIESVFDSEGRGFPGRHEIIVEEADLARARELVAGAALSAECVGCGRPIGDDGRWYSVGAGELVPYCAGCAASAFGPA